MSNAILFIVENVLTPLVIFIGLPMTAAIILTQGSSKQELEENDF